MSWLEKRKSAERCHLKVTRLIHYEHPETVGKGAGISSCQYGADKAADDIPSSKSRQKYKAGHIYGAGQS
jgi:hypothetical protein